MKKKMFLLIVALGMGAIPLAHAALGLGEVCGRGVDQNGADQLKFAGKEQEYLCGRGLSCSGLGKRVYEDSGWYEYTCQYAVNAPVPEGSSVCDAACSVSITNRSPEPVEISLRRVSVPFKSGELYTDLVHRLENACWKKAVRFALASNDVIGITSDITIPDASKLCH